jgi:hypothetical protein
MIYHTRSGLHISPSGRFKASYFIGFFPVAGILNRNGEPGLTPKIFAPFILTFCEGACVRIILGSLREVSLPAPQDKLIKRISR